MFLNELKKTLNVWLSGKNTDEWLFETFRDEVVRVLEPSEAYSLIDCTVQFLLSVNDESASIEILQTILCLAKTSQTTEVPQSILLNKSVLDSHFNGFGSYAQNKLNELYRYYRI